MREHLRHGVDIGAGSHPPRGGRVPGANGNGPHGGTPSCSASAFGSHEEGKGKRSSSLQPLSNSLSVRNGRANTLTKWAFDFGSSRSSASHDTIASLCSRVKVLYAKNPCELNEGADSLFKFLAEQPQHRLHQSKQRVFLTLQIVYDMAVVTLQLSVSGGEVLQLDLEEDNSRLCDAFNSRISVRCSSSLSSMV